jgi:hypothetical protein
MDHGFAASASSLQFRLCLRLSNKESCDQCIVADGRAGTQVWFDVASFDDMGFPESPASGPPTTPLHEILNSVHKTLNRRGWRLGQATGKLEAETRYLPVAEFICIA